MKLTKVLLIVSLSPFLCTSTSVLAATINTSFEAGTPWSVSNFAAWFTTGKTMGGLSVTANLRDSAGNAYQDNLSWVNGSGIVSADYNWSLTLNNYDANTWELDTVWTLNNTGSFTIESLVLDGKDANVVFDRIFSDPTNSTPGSESGRNIRLLDVSNTNLTINAKYKNEVGVGLATPVKDIYHTLSLNFVNGLGYNGGFGQEWFKFTVDTDNVNYDPVPEPATMILFGLGLAGLAGLRNRKKQI